MSSVSFKTTQFSLTLDEDRPPAHSAKSTIVDAGVMLWKERDSDAFWLKLFIRPTNNCLPKLKIACKPDLYEIRDYSHMFFAEDNLMLGYQSSDFSEMPINGTTKTPLFFAEHGQERNTFCRARVEQLTAKPIRSYIERTLNNSFYLTPTDFFTKAPLLKTGHNAGNTAYGIWIYGRIPQTISASPGQMEFSVRSYIPIKYLRFQVVLPAQLEVVENDCACTHNMFKIAVSSNPLIGRPGWIPLTDTNNQHEKFITTYYTVDSPFRYGGGTLSYRLKQRPIRRLIVYPDRFVFDLHNRRLISVELTPPAYALCLMLTIHYKDALPPHLTSLHVTTLLNQIVQQSPQNKDVFSQDDVISMLHGLRSALFNAIHKHIHIDSPEAVIAGEVKFTWYFTLLSRFLGERTAVDTSRVGLLSETVTTILRHQCADRTTRC
ncbi:MAG: hypothetical protein HZA88_20565 [Verrucomicrobia bacterium]|nr:hypothetical protein [Verrucomicrobiota bacterium]